MSQQTIKNRHRKVKEIFAEVIEFAPEKRADFLQTVCKNDNELLREVESLLKAREDAKGFLEEVSAVNVI